MPASKHTHGGMINELREDYFLKRSNCLGGRKGGEVHGKFTNKCFVMRARGKFTFREQIKFCVGCEGGVGCFNFYQFCRSLSVS